MSIVITPLTHRARDIFRDLGYDVTGEGGELRAERGWRTVRVTPMPEPGTPPTGGAFRCVVTWAEHAPALERAFAAADPDCEWAVIGVREEGYTVHGPG
jgi:hypothetical protein